MIHPLPARPTGLLLLPGLTGQAAEFAAQIDGFGPQRPVLAPLLLPRLVRLLARVLLVVLHTHLGAPVLRRFFNATFTEADPGTWRTDVLRRLERVPRHAARAAVRGAFTYDTASTIQALAVPTLVVRANIPVRTERLPAYVQSHHVTGAGHWPETSTGSWTLREGYAAGEASLPPRMKERMAAGPDVSQAGSGATTSRRRGIPRLTRSTPPGDCTA